MSTLTEDYVTVDEAAKLLKVAPSTIRRWIREGDLPAQRIGRRRVALKKSDLAKLIVPVRPAGNDRARSIEVEAIKRRRLTPEEVERALAALDRAQQHADETTAMRGGKIFSPPSWVLLNESRDERTRQLS